MADLGRIGKGIGTLGLSELDNALGSDWGDIGDVLSGDIGARLPLIGGMFENPGEREKQAALEEAKNMFGQAQGTVAQRRQQDLQAMMGFFNPARAQLQKMYGHGAAGPGPGAAPPPAPPAPATPIKPNFDAMLGRKGEPPPPLPGLAPYLEAFKGMTAAPPPPAPGPAPPRTGLSGSGGRRANDPFASFFR